MLKTIYQAQNEQDDFKAYLSSLNFQPDDLVCVTLIGPKTPKENGAGDAPVRNQFLKFSELCNAFNELSQQNNEWNIYLSMASFPDGTKSRLEKLGTPRHVYIDADRNGDEVLQQIEADAVSGLIPEPSVIVRTSPGKIQAIWGITATTSEAKALTQNLYEHYGTDKLKDTVRVLRLPGFKNIKYADKPTARLLSHIAAVRQIDDFKIAPQVSASAVAPSVATTATEPRTVPNEIPKEIWDGGPIQSGDANPHGGRNNQFTALAGWYRNFDKSAEEIYEFISEINREHCQEPLDDAELSTISYSVERYDLPKPEPKLLFGGKESIAFQVLDPESSMRKSTDAAGIIAGATPEQMQKLKDADAAKAAKKTAETAEQLAKWRNEFRTVGELDDGPIPMLIEKLLVAKGVVFLGGLPGEGKTLVALSIAKAAVTGLPLLGNPDWSVPQITPVIYMIPETSDAAFRKRCEDFKMPKDDRFLCRTISMGMPLKLDNPVLLEAIRRMKEKFGVGPIVILDTLVRFNESDSEDSASDNKKLSEDLMKFLTPEVGAQGILLLHHASKSARKEGLTLENTLRGTGDFGANAAGVFGLRRDDTLFANGTGPFEVDVMCLKPRDLVPPPAPFRVASTQVVQTKMGPVTTSLIAETGDLVLKPIPKKGLDAENIKKLTTGVLYMVNEDRDVTIESLVLATENYGGTQKRIKAILKAHGWSKKKGPNSTWEQKDDAGNGAGSADAMAGSNGVEAPGDVGMGEADAIAAA